MTRFSFMVIDTATVLADEATSRRCFELVSSCGYAGIELNITRPVLEQQDLLTSLAAAHELAIPSFLTGTAYAEGLCLCSPNASVRGAAVQRLIENLDLAARFDAILVVGLLQGLTSDEPDADAAHDRIVACLREVTAVAETRGVDLVMEPVNHLQVGFNNSVVEVRQLVSDVGSPALKPMVDTIHMNIEDESLTQPIRDCGADLRHVHLCESNGGPFGSGHIDFGAVLDTLDEIGYDGFASAKVYRKSTLDAAARSSIEFLRQLS